ncbi:unnamed protein product [Paramecium sonneborni]|uniref:Uncharacterized protein n=1 Tax=Paramecium sonneborni TaxID=65129 RepID=A0A8S1NIU3_9CILI|nr:unnamed protein product [Paramecium sonneborni]
MIIIEFGLMENNWKEVELLFKTKIFRGDQYYYQNLFLFYAKSYSFIKCKFQLDIMKTQNLQMNTSGQGTSYFKSTSYKPLQK